MALSAGYAILILCALSVFTPLSTYTIAVLKGHVDPVVPHIGKTGDKPPESTVFTQLVVITTAVVLLVIHIRFVFVESFCTANNIEPPYPKLNTISWYTGYVLCTGLLLLACFQESNSFYVHTISSTVLFTTGSVFYILIQTVMSYRLRRYIQSELTVYARIILSLLILISMLTYLIGFMLSNWWYKSQCCSETSWDQDEEGLKCHLISAVSEWILLGLYVVYILTYYNEFRMVILTTTKIYVTPLGGSASAEAVT